MKVGIKMTAKPFARLLSIINGQNTAHLAPVHFELAYQARLSVEKIKFVIKQLDSSNQDARTQESILQLLDVLDRLQSADQHFQDQFRSRRADRTPAQ